MSELDELWSEVKQIRAEVLEGGSAMGNGKLADDERERLIERSRELYARLSELWPQVDTAPPDERDGLAREWTNARMDAVYIMSEGKAPVSLELGARLPRPDA